MVNITIEIDELKVLEKAHKLTYDRLTDKSLHENMLTETERRVLQIRLAQIELKIAEVLSEMPTKELCNIDD